MLADLIGARSGHFVFESGLHGTLWLDLDALFALPARVAPFARELAARLAPYEIDVVCGPFSGGAFLASMVAERLGARFAYSMPPAYEVHHQHPGRRTAVVDDVVNAGSATTATVTALRASGAEVVVVAALMTLGPTGVARLAPLPLEVLESRPHDLWPPSACPLCAAGVPLDAGD